jgi:hypothetical protein
MENTSSEQQTQIRLADIAVTDQNTALNVMLTLLNLAHKRGVFSIEESAKIWDCVKVFQPPQQSSTTEDYSSVV